MIRIETLSAWIGPRGRSVTIHTRVYKRACSAPLNIYTLTAAIAVNMSHFVSYCEIVLKIFFVFLRGIFKMLPS